MIGFKYVGSCYILTWDFQYYEIAEANQLLNNHQSILIMFQTKCDYRNYVQIQNVVGHSFTAAE